MLHLGGLSGCVRIVLASFTKMFEYRLVMSKDANVKCGENGVSCNFWIRSLVFFMLKEAGVEL